MHWQISAMRYLIWNVSKHYIAITIGNARDGFSRSRTGAGELIESEQNNRTVLWKGVDGGGGGVVKGGKPSCICHFPL